jgi:hypothetical protein
LQRLSSRVRVLERVFGGLLAQEQEQEPVQVQVQVQGLELEQVQEREQERGELVVLQVQRRGPHRVLLLLHCRSSLSQTRYVQVRRRAVSVSVAHPAAAFCVAQRAKLVTSEEMDGPGRDLVVDHLLARMFRNLVSRVTETSELFQDLELIPGLIDLADAVTDVALGNAGALLVFCVALFSTMCSR